MIPARFRSLDLLRAAGAAAIVLFHWQHFFYVGGNPALSFVPTQQPFYSILLPFYRRGALSVDLFFCLSGFVFYWLYSQPIAKAKLTAWEFVVARIARLYPLHLLTLLWVAIGQAVFGLIKHSYFVYAYNDAYHFCLNLVLASSWGLERGYSFNAPVWTVSALVAVYAVFFFASRLMPMRMAVPAGLSLAGFWLVRPALPGLGRGIGSFFLGGCVYLVYAWIVRSGRTRKALILLPGVVAVLWIVATTAIHKGWDIGPWPYVSRIVWADPVLVLFPLTILTLALIETRGGVGGSNLRWIGDASYSAYLLHFPLQLSIIIVATLAGVDRAVFYSPLTMGAFLTALTVLSYASCRYLERPVQRLVRERWLPGLSRPRG